MDLLADDQDRYLLTILPEWHVGYGKRPSVHLVLRTHAATRSLQFAANTDRISWYSHLNGAYIADSAKTVLHMPLAVLAGSRLAPRAVLVEHGRPRPYLAAGGRQGCDDQAGHAP